MSDCSTNDMKPKEPPNTCWNCEDFSITGWCHEYEMGRSDTAPICKHYKKAQRPHVDTLEQRYQQLEQVAREARVLCNTLLEAIGDIATEDDAQLRACSALGAVSAAGRVMSYIGEQFKVLGVSVDD